MLTCPSKPKFRNFLNSLHKQKLPCEVVYLIWLNDITRWIYKGISMLACYNMPIGCIKKAEEGHCIEMHGHHAGTIQSTWNNKVAKWQASFIMFINFVNEKDKNLLKKEGKVHYLLHLHHYHNVPDHTGRLHHPHHHHLCPWPHLTLLLHLTLLPHFLHFLLPLPFPWRVENKEIFSLCPCLYGIPLFTCI